MEEKILIAEDDKFLRLIIAEILKHQKYNVIEAEDGQKAIDIIESEDIDLAIIDLMMPKIDGFELIKRIRSNPEKTHIPIIILSALSENKNIVKGIGIGADIYLSKPIENEILLVNIKNLLKRNKIIQDIDSLTHLPGPLALQEKFKRLKNSCNKGVFIYTDFDNFKEYNDNYGFEMGSKFIYEYAKTLVDEKNKLNLYNFSIWHIGGDDFAILIENSLEYKAYLYNVINIFKEKRLSFYKKEDIDKNYITAEGRNGLYRDYSILTISSAVILIDKLKVLGNEQFDNILIKTKKKAKEIKGFSLATAQL